MKTMEKKKLKKLNIKLGENIVIHERRKTEIVAHVRKEQWVEEFLILVGFQANKN